MGNVIMSDEDEQRGVLLESAENFLKPPEEDDTDNGYVVKGRFIPEEVLTMILSYVPSDRILKLGLVCKAWCKLIRSSRLWSIIYKRRFGTIPKRYPWYIFYGVFTGRLENNFLKNGNGQERLKHWTIIKDGGDGFAIEHEPQGADPLPEGVPEFRGRKSCYATSYGLCKKRQYINFSTDRLLLYILSKHKPHVYASEWVAGRFDCGCYYVLSCKLLSGDEVVAAKSAHHSVNQWEGKEWTKVELELEYDSAGVTGVVFEHEGKDTQFWKGHYGCKMAGGVVKFLLDSIRVDEQRD